MREDRGENRESRVVSGEGKGQRGKGEWGGERCCLTGGPEALRGQEANVVMLKQEGQAASCLSPRGKLCSVVLEVLLGRGQKTP